MSCQFWTGPKQRRLGLTAPLCHSSDFACACQPSHPSVRKECCNASDADKRWDGVLAWPWRSWGLEGQGKIQMVADPCCAALCWHWAHRWPLKWERCSFILGGSHVGLRSVNKGSGAALQHFFLTNRRESQHAHAKSELRHADAKSESALVWSGPELAAHVGKETYVVITNFVDTSLCKVLI